DLHFVKMVENLKTCRKMAAGTFEAQGRPINLKKMEGPLFLLAARHDELVMPPQLFAVEHLVGTPSNELRKLTADCRHLGLFMGKRILREVWSDIVDWLTKPDTMAKNTPASLPQHTLDVGQIGPDKSRLGSNGSRISGSA